MKIIKKRSVLSILCGLAIVLTGCQEGQEQVSTEIKHTSWDLPVAAVTSKALPKFYSATGSVVSDQRIEIASRTSGFVRKILVNEGERVSQGQELIMLDESDVEGAIRQSQAALGKATSALKDAQTDLTRFEALFNRGSISETRLRKIRLQRDLAQASLNEVRAVLGTARAQRQYTRISSPLAGVVVTRHKREGDLAAPGLAILTVESDHGLLLETFVAESRVGKIKQGDSVQVTIDALDAPITGVITRIVPSGDPITRRYQVKIILDETQGLLPGMFGRAHFRLGTETALIIPETAWLERGGLRGVFVVDSDSRAHFRWLRTGRIEDSNTVVQAGLEEGEQIVTVVNAGLRDGDIIKAANRREESVND